MAILIRSDTRVIVQGITGHQGQFHARAMAASGTKVVAGVTPGKGGQFVDTIPVYDTVREAVEATGADAWVSFVPAAMAQDAAYEAIDHQLNPMVLITEHIPIHDTVKIVSLAANQGIRVVGPNTAGLFAPGHCKMGIMLWPISFGRGPIGIVSSLRDPYPRNRFGSSPSKRGLGNLPPWDWVEILSWVFLSLRSLDCLNRTRKRKQ